MRSNRPSPDFRITGNDPASQALRGIQSSHALFQTLRPQRQRFADALGLNWTGTANQVAAADDPENFSEHANNLSYRYMGYLKSQTAGMKPVIKYPRDAGAGQAPEGTLPGIAQQIPGDESTAEYAEILINRAVSESGAINEWRDAFDDIGAWGCGIVSIGFDRDVVSPELYDNMSRSVEDISLLATQGDIVAKPGERHLDAAKHLRGMVEMAMNEEEAFELSSQEAEFVLARAQSHDSMSVAEARKPLPSPWRGHKIWARRGQIGVDIFWDSTVSRLEDARWMSRRVEMTLEEFKANGLFKPSAQKKIKGLGRRGETGFDGSDGERRRDQAQGEEERHKIVVLYEVWQRRPEMTEGGLRRFVSTELPGEWIERDNTNPYIDAQRRPLIPGFFPIYVAAPITAPVNDPTRPFGIPAIAPGWPQQLEANTFRSLSIAAAKRNAIRCYVYSRDLKGRANKKALAALFRGEDGTGIMAPAGVKTKADMQGLVVPVQFQGNNTEIDRQEARNEEVYRQVMSIPAAVLAGAGASETLGQDEMAAAAGRSQQGDIVGQVELVFASMCEGIRGLLKKYPVEKVAALIGAEGATVIQAWQASSLEGDALEVSFGARAAAVDAVAKKQLMETIALLQQWVDPMGNPMVDLTPYYAELVRAQGLGKVKLIDPEMKQLMQMADIGAAMIEAVGEDGVGQILNGGGPEGGSSPSSGASGGSPVKASGNDPRSPTNANIGVGARRGASTVNN